MSGCANGRCCGADSRPSAGSGGSGERCCELGVGGGLGGGRGGSDGQCKAAVKGLVSGGADGFVHAGG